MPHRSSPRGARTATIDSRTAVVLPAGVAPGPEPITIDWRDAAAVFCQAVLIVGLLWRVLELGRKSWTTPFVFWGDCIFSVANAGAVIETGWIWHNPLLGAPYGFPIVAFPANNYVDYALVWLFARFSSSPGVVLNLAWLSTFVIGGAVAYYSLRLLGVQRVFAAGFGIVYAFLPHAFYRNTTHFVLTFYLVPLACVIAITAATGWPLTRAAKRILLSGAALIGFNYIYASAFSILAIASGLLIGWVALRKSVLKSYAAASIVIIVATTALSLAPSIVYWQIHGKPFEEYKRPADAEILGLKIRHLISPVFPSDFAPAHAWLERERIAEFPDSGSEASVSRLGTLLAIGFLLLLGILIFGNWRPSDAGLLAAARLNAVFLVVSTVGGLGAVFNLLVYPGIRAYNRTVVFIAFFSAFVLARMLTDLCRRRSAGARRVIVGTFVVVVAIAVFDEAQAAQTIVGRYEVDDRDGKILKDAVGHLERLCGRCSVYQLPDTDFPPDGPHLQMLPYDHGRPHAFSRKLHWSWPSFGRERTRFGQALLAVPAPEMVSRLRSSAFRFVWIDRSAYPDRARSPEPGIGNIVGDPAYVSSDGRYAVYDIGRPDLEKRISQQLTNAPIFLHWSTGFYEEERNANDTWRWSYRSSTIEVRNLSDTPQKLMFSGRYISGQQHPCELRITVPGHTLSTMIYNTPSSITVPMKIDPRGSAPLMFQCTCERVQAAARDPRSLYFAIHNPTIDLVHQ
jgi:hypothetical protein